MKKSFSIFLCFVVTLVMAIAPMTTALATESSATNSKSDAPTNTTTTVKTTTATKTTAKKTTTKTNTRTTAASNNGKLTVSSKRSTQGSGEGGKVTVIYTIENTGSIAAKSLKLKDPDIAGTKTIEEISTLAAGDSKTVEYEATMTRDSTSTPTVTCTMNGTSKTFTGESTRISLTGTSSALSATLTTSNTQIQPNTPTSFSLVLKNDDTKKISDISVTDHSGNSIKSGISLDAGSSTTLQFQLTLTADTTVYVNISGKDSSGSSITAKSNELAMKVSGDTVPVNEGLSITIYANNTELEKAGDIQLTLEVHNAMSRPYTNVNIVDQATGSTLQTVALLSANDTKTYTSTVNIQDNTSFQYTATAMYEDGTAVSVTSNSLEIKLNKGGLFSNMTVIIVIIVLVVVGIIGVSITLYILSKKEKEKNKALGATQSKKYKKAPKKRAKDGRDNMPPPPPMSTFTIDEDSSAPPTFDTSPIQLPKDNAFDNYGEGIVENPEIASIPEESPIDNTQEQSFGNDTNEFIPFSEEAQIPNNQQQIEPEQPPKSEPMNYNDLDPD